MNSEVIIQADEPLGRGVVAYWMIFPDLYFFLPDSSGGSPIHNFILKTLQFSIGVAQLPHWDFLQ